MNLRISNLLQIQLHHFVIVIFVVAITTSLKDKKEQ